MVTTLYGRPLVEVRSAGGERFTPFADLFPFGRSGPNCNRCGRPVAGHSPVACPGGKTRQFTEDPRDGSMAYPAAWVVGALD